MRADYVSLTLIAVLWSVFFLKCRKTLDYYRLQRRSENQEPINDFQAIKLSNFEDYKRRQW